MTIQVPLPQYKYHRRGIVKILEKPIKSNQLKKLIYTNRLMSNRLIRWYSGNEILIYFKNLTTERKVCTQD